MIKKIIISKRIQQTREILKVFGLPAEQRNERAALTLLALLDMKPDTPWSEATAPLIGVTPIMDYAAKYYGRKWAPNTRETIRRFTLHQYVQAGLVTSNPDEPARPTNSPFYCYQIGPEVLTVIRKFGSRNWEALAKEFTNNLGGLAKRYAQERDYERIPLRLAKGEQITLTPGGQNELMKAIIEEFCPRFIPKAKPIYIGDTGNKWAYFNETHLNKLGVEIESHGKMPDAVIYFPEKNWLVLIEAVTSHGPVSPKRLAELKSLFSKSKAGLVFITAFIEKTTFHKYLSDIAWETEVWVASDPDHLIHFNGERFLGPY